MSKIIRGKCLIVGDSTVGKSTLTQAYCSDGQNIVKNYSMTTGFDILTKLVTLIDSDYTVEYLFYDCAGKECFYNLVQKAWEHPNMIVVIFDLTNDVSFTNSARWLERVKNAKLDIKIPVICIGNKSDLSLRRVVKREDIDSFCEKNQLEYFECSAKDNHGVAEAFINLAKQYRDLYKECLANFDELI